MPQCAHAKTVLHSYECLWCKKIFGSFCYCACCEQAVWRDITKCPCRGPTGTLDYQLVLAKSAT
jgi:hypothetical protein